MFMNYATLRKELISNPRLLSELCFMLGVLQRNDGPCRMLNSWKSNGFSVTVEVDDDNLSEDEKKAHYADLADQCIKILKSKGGLKNVG